LVFDGECGFCTMAVGWMKRLDRARRIVFVPCQADGLIASIPLGRADCMRAAWAIEPDGTRHRGAGAVNAGLAYAMGNRLLLRLYSIRPVGWFQDRLYGVVAWGRRWLPGVDPYCRQHPERCRPGST
jgi:predicted DCC family thiol-disulfide oxidoreductase YuxK